MKTMILILSSNFVSIIHLSSQLNNLRVVPHLL